MSFKAPHASISTFTVTPAQSVLDSDGRATVTLAWTTADATALWLQGSDGSNQDVTNATTTTATIRSSTSFTLVADGPKPGGVDNRATVQVVAQVLPVIDTFTASPSSLYAGDQNTSVALQWDVNTDGEVTLTSSVTGPFGSVYPSSDTASVTLAEPQMLTLEPKGGYLDPKVSRSLVFSSFGIVMSQVSTNGGSFCCAASPNAGFVAMTMMQSNSVSILSTADYTLLASVPTGQSPFGIAFSPDGGLMYVANTGDGTVSIFTVAASLSTPPFSFSPAATVPVGAAPGNMAVGPDGTAWVGLGRAFWATAGSIVAITRSGTQFTATPPLAVGKNVCSLAVSPTGTSVFAACMDGTVWEVTAAGGTPAATQILSGLGMMGLGLAVSPDGRWLLVASNYAYWVYIYDTKGPITGPDRQVGISAPFTISALPTGRYALVTGAEAGGAGSVYLIDYEAEPPSVLAKQPLPTPALFSMVAPEGGVGLLTLSGGSIEVVTFARYQPFSPLPALGTAAVNLALAVSPDSAMIVVWARAMDSGFRGVLKVPVDGGPLQAALPDMAITALAISPVAGEDALYVAQSGSSSIELYGLSTMVELAAIPLQGQGPAGRQPVSLGVSADGSALFTLMADNDTQYSVVVLSADVETRAFSIVADLTVSANQDAQLAVVPVSGGGMAAWLLEAGTNRLWKIAKSGGAWQVASQAVTLAPDDEGWNAFAMACSPDGSTAYVAITNGVLAFISVIDLTTGTSTLRFWPSIRYFKAPDILAVSADGAWLYVRSPVRNQDTNWIYSGICILDTKSLRVNQTVTSSNATSEYSGLASARDGSALFSIDITLSSVVVARQVGPS